MFQISEKFINRQEQKTTAEDQKRETNRILNKKIQDSGVVEALKEAEASEITLLSRFIIVLAIVADLFGLIPLAGNFLGLFFGIILVILYFLNGLGKGAVARKVRKLTRRWLLRTVLYLIEILALGFSWLPLFTIEALIDYNLSKKGYYKKITKAQEIINKNK